MGLFTRKRAIICLMSGCSDTVYSFNKVYACFLCCVRFSFSINNYCNNTHNVPYDTLFILYVVVSTGCIFNSLFYCSFDALCIHHRTNMLICFVRCACYVPLMLSLLFPYNDYNRDNKMTFRFSRKTFHA